VAYADAIVTGCVPSSTLGNFRFNITYVDYVGRYGRGRPNRNSGAFQTNGVVLFADPVVVWDRYTIAFHRTASKSDNEIEKEFIIPMGIVKSNNLKPNAPPTL
jgi:hypothetical protein